MVKENINGVKDDATEERMNWKGKKKEEDMTRMKKGTDWMKQSKIRCNLQVKNLTNFEVSPHVTRTSF